MTLSVPKSNCKPTATKVILFFVAVAAAFVLVQLNAILALPTRGRSLRSALPQPETREGEIAAAVKEALKDLYQEGLPLPPSGKSPLHSSKPGDGNDDHNAILVDSSSKLVSLLTEVKADVASLEEKGSAVGSIEGMTHEELNVLRNAIDGVIGEKSTADAEAHVEEDQCSLEYERVNKGNTRGLTQESLLRSKAWIGNSERLRHVASVLHERERPLEAVVFGASISCGHGVMGKHISNEYEGESGRYSNLLEDWLNDFYPMKSESKRQHRVLNWSSHGASMCSLAKRVRLVVEELKKENADPDMFILEFAVNDYQGQGDSMPKDEKLDVYFDGFEDVALCAEVVVNHLLRQYPHAAVTFLEMRTAVLERKTAQSLHMGVAQHYEVPVISFAEAMFPEYIRLVSMLNASDSYTVPQGASLLPYPYGCAPCQKESISKQFLSYRDGCVSMCDLLWERAGLHPNCSHVPPGMEHCHVPIFAHDDVHPSGAGHRIAKDLLANAISNAMRDHCLEKPFAKHLLPSDGWLATPKALQARGQGFVFVNDTKHQYAGFRKLVPSSHTPGWSLYSDVSDKLGWITTSRNGNETISFDIDLPQRPCYAVYVAVLRSYNGMGKFTVDVEDLKTGRSSSVEADGKWNAPISIWYDYQVTQDQVQEASCTGKCKITVRNQDQLQDRTGNKVKIMTLSARECVA